MRTILSLNILPLFISSYFLKAMGPVTSFTMTKSTSATTICPAFASVCECSDRIFSAIVFPI